MSAPTPDELSARLKELQRKAAALAPGKPARRGGKPPGLSVSAWVAQVNLAAEGKVKALLARLEKENG